MWDEVENKGYYVFDIEIPEEIWSPIYYDTYVPFEHNPQIGICPSMEVPAYNTLLTDYENPRNIKMPKHLEALQKLANPYIDMTKWDYDLITTDIVKYNNRDEPHDKGPYLFHYDDFPKLVFMYFVYLTGKEKVEGRELQIRYEKGEPETVSVKNGRVVVMNSWNDSFQHRVIPLRSKEHVILTTNYIWKLDDKID